MEENVNVEKREEKKTFWQKVKGVGKTVTKYAVPVIAGVAAGYVARKYIDADVYADAAEQRAWRERKSGNN